MAAAWEQLEAVQAANQARRLRQLAQATRDTILDHKMRYLSEDKLLQVTAPAHTRLQTTASMSGRGTATFFAQMQMQRSTSSAPLLDNARDLRGTALRRITRPRGAINRRFLPATVRQTQTRPLIGFLHRPAPLPGGLHPRNLSVLLPPQDPRRDGDFKRRVPCGRDPATVFLHGSRSASHGGSVLSLGRGHRDCARALGTPFRAVADRLPSRRGGTPESRTPSWWWRPNSVRVSTCARSKRLVAPTPQYCHCGRAGLQCYARDHTRHGHDPGASGIPPAHV